MGYRDPYDPCVAFDDLPQFQGEYQVLGGDETDSGEGVGFLPWWYVPGIGIPGVPVLGRHDRVREVVRAAAERALSRRLAAPPYYAVLLGGDPTARTFQLPHHAVVLGAEAEVPAGQRPLFEAIRERFRRAVGSPRAARLDGEESYREFRRARLEPYVRRLADRLEVLERAYAEHVEDDHGERLDALERAFEQHVSDGHGGRLERAGNAVVGALVDAQRGGTPVPLPVAAVREGKVECWQDGDEVLCTARFCLADGSPRYATTAEPVAPHVEETLGCLSACGADAEVVYEHGPQLAQALAARAALGAACRAVPELVGLAGGAPVVAAVGPRTDPGLAAAVALAQRAQRGDRRAAGELDDIWRSGGRRLAETAVKLLAAGQAAKARAANWMLRRIT